MERDVANATKIFTIIIRAAYLSKFFCPTEPRLLIMSCISVTWKCAVGLLLVAVFTGCVRVWMSNKRYVFSAEEIDGITQRILQKTG